MILLCSFFFFQAEDGIRDHCVTGVQTCALPIWKRLTFISWLNFDSHSSTAPVIGEALEGWGVHARGIWPSPANRLEVGSSPTQPAPGKYTSHHACKSVKSRVVPDGPSRDCTSGVNCTR